MISFNDFNKNTIPEMLFIRAAYSANDLAYCFPELNQALTWSEMQINTRRISENLIHLGVGKGDKVAILMEGRIETILTMFATASLGAMIVPLNTYSKKEEIKAYLNDARPSVFVMGEEGQHIKYPQLMCEIIASAEEEGTWIPRHIFVLDDKQEVHAPFHSFKKLMKADKPLDNELYTKACRATVAEDPFVLIYTSGTTGFPKAVSRTLASFMVSDKDPQKAKRQGKSFFAKITDRFTSRFSMLNLLPLYHLGGVAVLFTSLRVCNIRTVLITHFNPLTALNLAEREKCQFLVGTPFMLQYMLAARPSGKYQLNAIRGVAFTSSAVNGVMIDRITQHFKKLMLFIVSYGSSEAGAVANGTCFFKGNANIFMTIFFKLMQKINLLSGMIDYEEFGKTPYSIGGRIDKAVEVRIIDPASGEILPNGSEGEICINSHRVMKYTNPTLTGKRFTDDNWYRSGDLGFINEKGLLVITGRINRIISRGGEKISPVEIENTMLKNPAIHDVMVIGLPDELYGERVCAAYIEKQPGSLDHDDLRMELSQSLSDFKIPRFFVSLPEFPLSPTGKVAVGELQKLMLEKISTIENRA